MTYLDTINYKLVGPEDFELIVQDWAQRLEEGNQFKSLHSALCVLAEFSKAVFNYNAATNTATLTYVGI